MRWCCFLPPPWFPASAAFRTTHRGWDLARSGGVVRIRNVLPTNFLFDALNVTGLGFRFGQGASPMLSEARLPLTGSETQRILAVGGVENPFASLVAFALLLLRSWTGLFRRNHSSRLGTKNGSLGDLAPFQELP